MHRNDIPNKNYGVDIINVKTKCFVVLLFILVSISVMNCLSMPMQEKEESKDIEHIHDEATVVTHIENIYRQVILSPYVPPATTEFDYHESNEDAEPDVTSPTYLDIPLSEELQEYTDALSVEYNIPQELPYAIMFIESEFIPNTISATNDYGLMQINRINHTWLRNDHGITDFLDPRQNILCGIIIIADLYSKYKCLHKTLMAYNMGEAGARKQWNQGVITSVYSTKVVTHMQSFEVQRNILIKAQKEI